MALPTNPSDGDTATVAGQDYVYTAATDAWTKVAAVVQAKPSIHHGGTAPANPIAGDIWIKAKDDVQFYIGGKWEDWPMGSDLPDDSSNYDPSLPVFNTLAARISDLETQVAGHHSATVRLGFDYATLPNPHGYMKFLDVPDAAIGGFLNGQNDQGAMLFIRSNVRIDGTPDVHVTDDGTFWWWNQLGAGSIAQGNFTGPNQTLVKGLGGTGIDFVKNRIAAYGNASTTVTEDNLFGSYKYVYVLPMRPSSYVTGGANGYWPIPTRTNTPGNVLAFYID